MSLLIRNARVLTIGGGPSGALCGRGLGELGILPAADVLIDAGRIVGVTPHATAGASPAPRADETIDAVGRVLMPAFVDCHTHACWVGDRLDEWQMKLRGVAYLDILKAGGGIMSSVRAVRAASQRQLEDALLERLDAFLRHGTTTIEIKSGYCLSTDAELKMLRAIAGVRSRWPGTIIATALLGHAIDPDIPDFIDRTIHETLPAVHAEFSGVAIDAFCEKGAWSLEQCVRLFEAARALGHPIRVHADQFNSLGMIPEAIRLGATSVDHLEATTPEDAARLSASDTFAVALPCCGLHLANATGAGQWANLRRILDAPSVPGGGGGRVAIATNCNPGSSPTLSMPMAIAAAVRFCGLTPAEAIAASTRNPAALLGFTDRGVIAPGMRADLVVLHHRDERNLAFELGGNAVKMVVCAGNVVARAN